MRSDLAAPRLKRVSDKKNYGDDVGAHSVVNPNIYASRGLHERDLLQPRDKAEVRITTLTYYYDTISSVFPLYSHDSIYYCTVHVIVYVYDNDIRMCLGLCDYLKTCVKCNTLARCSAIFLVSSSS